MQIRIDFEVKCMISSLVLTFWQARLKITRTICRHNHFHLQPSLEIQIDQEVGRYIDERFSRQNSILSIKMA